MEHAVPSENFQRETGLPFQKFHFFRKFSSGTNQKVVFHLHPNRNFRNFLVNGKRPKVPLFPEIFQWNKPKNHVSFTTQPEFPESLGKWKTPLVTSLASLVFGVLCLYWSATALTHDGSLRLSIGIEGSNAEMSYWSRARHYQRRLLTATHLGYNLNL